MGVFARAGRAAPHVSERQRTPLLGTFIPPPFPPASLTNQRCVVLINNSLRLAIPLGGLFLGVTTSDVSWYAVVIATLTLVVVAFAPLRLPRPTTGLAADARLEIERGHACAPSDARPSELLARYEREAGA